METIPCESPLSHVSAKLGGKVGEWTRGGDSGLSLSSLLAVFKSSKISFLLLERGLIRIICRDKQSDLRHRSGVPRKPTPVPRPHKSHRHCRPQGALSRPWRFTTSLLALRQPRGHRGLTADPQRGPQTRRASQRALGGVGGVCHRC